MSEPEFPQRVTLTETEMKNAAWYGIQRNIENINKGRESAHGHGGQNDWQLHIEGVAGELAVSKALGIPWKGKGAIGEPDLSNGDEVRQAGSHNLKLIIRPGDKEDARYWLVTGRYGHYIVHGWIWGSDGKETE